MWAIKLGDLSVLYKSHTTIRTHLSNIQSDEKINLIASSSSTATCHFILSYDMSIVYVLYIIRERLIFSIDMSIVYVAYIIRERLLTLSLLMRDK